MNQERQTLSGSNDERGGEEKRWKSTGEPGRTQRGIPDTTTLNRTPLAYPKMSLEFTFAVSRALQFASKHHSELTVPDSRARKALLSW
jgi:hypothetical protein